LTNSPASLSIEGSQLSVPSEKTLSLIGGDLTINQAELVATFGRLNLASVAGIGEVIPKSDDLSVSTPFGSLTVQNSQIASNDDIYIRGGRFELTNSSVNTNVLAQEGSAIDIAVENLKLQNSVIGSTTTSSGKGSTIKISVNDVLTIGGRSALMNFATNSGNAGNIDIKARQMAITDGSMIFNITSGTGSAGNIDIDTHQMTLKNGSYVFNTTLGTGNSGNINLKAHQIALTDGSVILNTTFGNGNGGNIIIKVIDTLTISGVSSDQTISSTIANTSPSTELVQQLCPSCSLDDNHDIGKTGKIDIEARQITLTEGANILSGTIGSGDSGTVNLEVADTLTLSGSKILSSSKSEEANAGNAGNIEIKANQLILKNGAQIDGSTIGPGQGSNIVIQVGDSVSLSGSLISATTTGTMNKAGIGGQIMLQAKQLLITDSARISTSTIGHGNGGNIALQIGDSITLTDGAYIASNTQGSGKGGIIGIKVSNDITLTKGANITSGTSGLGEGGGIVIKARQITLTDAAQITSGTSGAGNGGIIYIKETDTLTLSNSNVLGNSESVAADAGDALGIIIEVRQITLTDGAQITSGTFGPGKGGGIIIKVADTLTASGQNEKGFSSGIFGNSQGTQADAGDALGIVIEARQITLMDGAQIASGTLGPGKGGGIFIAVGDTLTASGQNEKGFSSGIFGNSQSTQANAGDALGIVIEARQITLTDGAQIASGTFGPGEGGGIIIAVADTLTASGQNEGGFSSGIFGSSESKGSNAGNAGQILVQANRINLTNGGKINTETGNAAGGSITVTTPALLYLQEGQITTSVKGGKGDGGNITIGPPTFVVMDDGKIIAQAVEGHGGNITIDSQQFVRTTDAENPVDASSKLGISGNVVITAPENDIAGSLIVLSANLLDVSGLLQKPCSAMSYEEYINRSRLLVIPLAGSSLSPFDLKPSHLPRRSKKSAKRSTAPKTGNGDKTTKVIKPGAKVMVCRAFTSAKNRKSTVSPEQLF